ncbi:MAG TPA: carboxypeptidase regulatory-like domain-containing protein [Terracidiphilus sp.]|jgi:hypothetical protein|nr:carboxypeptidase regulatory-like domain-containing protein [Terracidiphilus sp.]
MMNARRFVGRALVLSVCLAMGLPAIRLQAQQGAPRPGAGQGQKLYRIAGTVTNAMTGEPVVHATVSLVDEEARDTLWSVESGNDGQFSLERVPAAKYGLRVTKRGYLTSFFDEHDGFSSAIVAGEGLDTEHIPFRLRPGATVHGVVTDDAGEPVQQAQVLLMRKSKATGLGEKLVRSISGTTDDMGGFEFWDLMPGTYFLAVKATPWYALHPSLSGRTADGTEQETAALDVAYPVTYFDGTTEEAGATPITLTSGDRAEVNLALHAVTAVHLMVHTGETPNRGNRDRPDGFVETPMLRQTIFGEEQMGGGPDETPGPPGSGLVEISGVAPGHYSVMEGTPPRIVDVDASGSGEQEVDMAGAQATVSVDLKAHMADGSAVPEAVQFALTPDELTGGAGDGRITLQGGTHFHSVTPGVWDISAFSNNLGLSVVGVESAHGNVQGSRIAVKTVPLQLTVELAQGATRVLGFARKNGKGMPEMMIVLVPQNPAANLTLFRRDQSDSDGSFALRDVVPGRYTVVAIEDGWELDWARPEVIARYLKGGTSVTVSSQSGKTVVLPTPVEVQPR